MLKSDWNICRRSWRYSKYEVPDIVRDRVKTGLDRAKKEGKKLGRPTNFNEGMGQSVRLLRQQGMPIKQIAKNLEIGVGTVYKALDKVA